jgi:hypothetical protein
MSLHSLSTHDVIPAQAGIHSSFSVPITPRVDSRLRGNDAVALMVSEFVK